jgi:hypothetical protein
MGKLNGRDHLEDVGIDVTIILEWILDRVGSYGLEASGIG